MSKIDISIETKNKVVGKVSTKKKIDANIYPRGPQGPQGIQGPRGETGNGIANIEKTNTIGLVDTYTITFTNGTTFNFTVTNANVGNTYTKSEIEQFLAQKVNISDIINTLTSDETNKPLSAKQGKVLKGLIDNTYTSSEIDTFLGTINGNISNLNDTKLNKTVITDAYSSSSTYAVGDYCIYGNTLYKCTTAIATAEAWNSGHWTAVTVADEINARVKKAGDRMSGDLTMDNSIIKIANGSQKGINNASNLPIIRDHANSCVTVDATGNTLFLGYQNTANLNILNGKITIDSNGDIKAPIFTTTSTVSNYFTTVNANQVIRFGKIVHVVFRGYVNTAIPNNTTFLTVPYKSAIGNIESGLVGGYGGQYNIETPFWAYLDESGGIRCGGVPADKWVHINMTYITSD